jgi:hypothetical protein
MPEKTYLSGFAGARRVQRAKLFKTPAKSERLIFKASINEK